MTTSSPKRAGNFGRAGPMDHATRYESAAEIVEVEQGLWDSWEEWAKTTTWKRAKNSDKTKVHSLDHVGKFIRCAGHSI